jgi:hypothetical protein
MVYPNTGSILSPKVNTSLSTQITIKVDGTTVGAIQQLQLNQNRDMNVWEEIGTDGIVEIHPKGAAKIDLTVQRAVFDQLHITEAFARGFVNIQAQRIPFNIQILDRMGSADPKNTTVHVCNSCWFKSYGTTITSSNYLIMENASLVCEYITTTVDGVSSVHGGLRGIKYVADSIERFTDTEGRRGKFDSAGVIK